MGRKIKPIGLHRKPISVSLSLDVIGWLDRLVLASEGVTRSRTIESALRNAMSKGQTTLDESIYLWRCKTCEWEGTSKKHPKQFKGTGLRFCKKCQSNQIYYAGDMSKFQGEEEE